MKNIYYSMRFFAGLFLISSLSMCAKTVNKIEQPASGSTTITPGTTTDGGTAIVPGINAVNGPTYTVQASQWFVDGATIAPGTTIYILAGTRGSLLFKNLKGTAANPIIITNTGGRATLSTTLTASYGLKTQNCQYFKILGNGVSSIKYGIDVNGGNIGMTLDDLSSDFEIANVEVRNSGFAGIMAKTDPSCDIATQRGHFTMSNVILHHNYVHNTGGEGFYVGNSFYAEGVSLSCGTALPHDVINAKIYGNLIDSAGCEGIQLGGGTVGAQIYSNTIKSPGLKPFASGQNNGIQVGEGTGGACFNNLIKDAPGNGIIVLGWGNNTIFNNYIINAGGHGIFADSRFTPGPYFRFINNTIINPGQNGIRLNSETIPMNLVINNAIIMPGSGVAISRMSSGVKLTASNNYMGTNINLLNLISVNLSDLHLLSTSPLINAGIDATSYGVAMDYYGKPRPVGGVFDIGAVEYQ